MTSVHCPICDRDMQSPGKAKWPHFPFCSDRCRLIDLGRWLGEKYRVRPEAEGEAAETESGESEFP